MNSLHRCTEKVLSSILSATTACHLNFLLVEMSRLCQTVAEVLFWWIGWCLEVGFLVRVAEWGEACFISSDGVG